LKGFMALIIKDERCIFS